MVSADGSVYFTEAGSGQLFRRLNPTQVQSQMSGGKCTEAAKACTVQVSVSEKTNGEGPGGTDAAGRRPSAFIAASSDGSKAFFTSAEKLTDDANTGPEPPRPPSAGRRPTAAPQASNPPSSPARRRRHRDRRQIHLLGQPNRRHDRPLPTRRQPSARSEFITGAGRPQYVAVDGTTSTGPMPPTVNQPQKFCPNVKARSAGPKLDGTKPTSLHHRRQRTAGDRRQPTNASTGATRAANLRPDDRKIGPGGDRDREHGSTSSRWTRTRRKPAAGAGG